MTAPTRAQTADEPVEPRRPRRSVPEVIAPRVRRLELVDPSPPGWRLPVALGVIVLLLVMALWGWVDELQTHAVDDALPRIELPSVAGSDQASAQAQLEALGFVVSVRSRPNEVVPAGTVFGEEPVPGAKVEQGDLVSVLVSSGPAGVGVPSMVGQQVVDAQALLASDGLTGAVTEVYSELVRAGEVMATVPKAGGHVPQAGSVALTVSKGPMPRTVPEVVGKDLNSSLVALGRAGVGIGTITKTYKAGQPENVVLSSDPAAGAQVPRDQPVKLTVTGPAPTSTVPAMTGLLPSTASLLAKTAGIDLDQVSKPVAPGDPTIGRVVGQGVPPYASVPTGSSVQIMVAVGDPSVVPPGG